MLNNYDKRNTQCTGSYLNKLPSRFHVEHATVNLRAALIQGTGRAMALASASIKLLLIATQMMSFNAAVADNGDDDFGPYLEVFPLGANLSQNQFDCVPAENKTCPLYIALTMSFGKEYVSSGVIPSVQYALDQINNDPDLLPGYTLHYTLTDSQVQLQTFL